jgi:hypothetical protein
MTDPTWIILVFALDSEEFVEERQLGRISLAEAQEAFSCPPEETMHGLSWRVEPVHARWLRSRGEQDWFDFDHFSYFFERDPDS